MLPLAASLGDDLLGLLARLFDEAHPLADQLLGLDDLGGQGFTQGIHRLDGVLLIDKPATAEGDAAAFENNLLELIQLIEDGDAGLRHVNRGELSN